MLEASLEEMDDSLRWKSNDLCGNEPKNNENPLLCFECSSEWLYEKLLFSIL